MLHMLSDGKRPIDDAQVISRSLDPINKEQSGPDEASTVSSEIGPPPEKKLTPSIRDESMELRLIRPELDVSQSGGRGRLMDEGCLDEARAGGSVAITQHTNLYGITINQLPQAQPFAVNAEMARQEMLLMQSMQERERQSPSHGGTSF